MAKLESVVTKIVAPVPIGNRVEVVWYSTTKSGWRGPTQNDHPHVPRIVDLDTGVEYVSSVLVEQDHSMWDQSKPLPTHEGLRDDLVVERTLVGKVRRCRVATIGSGEIAVQTLLQIEPDPSAYR